MKPTLMNPTTMPVACHATPLTDELLERYKSMIDALKPGPIKDALLACFTCAFAWWNARESTKSFKEKWTTTGGKEFEIIPFDAELIAEFDAVTPWAYEVEAMGTLFSSLPTGLGKEVDATAERAAYTPVVDQAARDLRDAAFHLHWFAEQITRDREPPTLDKLK